MKKQNLVKDALTCLRNHFGPRLLMFPPITSEAFQPLEKIVGRLPPDLVTFLHACNGLRIDVVGGEEAHVWGTPRVLASAVDPGSSIVPRCFLPLRGDPTGGRDWIVTEFKPAFGVIVHWDPWTPAIQLMASSLGEYLNAWADYMKDCYGSDGRPVSLRPRGAFDVHWMKNDSCLARLRGEQLVVDWLKRIADAATCADSGCHAKLHHARCGPMVCLHDGGSVSVQSG